MARLKKIVFCLGGSFADLQKLRMALRRKTSLEKQDARIVETIYKSAGTKRAVSI